MSFTPRAYRRSWSCWAEYVGSRRVQAERQRVAALRCFGSLVQRSVRRWRQHVALLQPRPRGSCEAPGAATAPCNTLEDKQNCRWVEQHAEPLQTVLDS